MREDCKINTSIFRYPQKYPDAGYQLITFIVKHRWLRAEHN